MNLVIICYVILACEGIQIAYTFQLGNARNHFSHVMHSRDILQCDARTFNLTSDIVFPDHGIYAVSMILISRNL